MAGGVGLPDELGHRQVGNGETERQTQDALLGVFAARFGAGQDRRRLLLRQAA